MDQATYLQIVYHYLAAAFQNLPSDKGRTFETYFAEQIRAAALRWASERGGRSGRVAYQFSRYWQGKTQLAAQDEQL